MPKELEINRAQIFEGKHDALFLAGCPKPLKNLLPSQFGVKTGMSWEGFFFFFPP